MKVYPGSVLADRKVPAIMYDELVSLLAPFVYWMDLTHPMIKALYRLGVRSRGFDDRACLHL